MHTWQEKPADNSKRICVVYTYAVVFANVLHVLAFGLQYFAILPTL